MKPASVSVSGLGLEPELEPGPELDFGLTGFEIETEVGADVPVTSAELQKMNEIFPLRVAVCGLRLLLASFSSFPIQKARHFQPESVAYFPGSSELGW